MRWVGAAGWPYEDLKGSADDDTDGELGHRASPQEVSKLLPEAHGLRHRVGHALPDLGA